MIKRQGAGVRETFTVRKQSFGVGVERTFPVHSPKIEKIEVKAIGDVNRAKLYYLRGKVGKKARVREIRGARREAARRPRRRRSRARRRPPPRRPRPSRGAGARGRADAQATPSPPRRLGRGARRPQRRRPTRPRRRAPRPSRGRAAPRSSAAAGRGASHRVSATAVAPSAPSPPGPAICRSAAADSRRRAPRQRLHRDGSRGRPACRLAHPSRRTRFECPVAGRRGGCGRDRGRARRRRQRLLSLRPPARRALRRGRRRGGPRSLAGPLVVAGVLLDYGACATTPSGRWPT